DRELTDFALGIPDEEKLRRFSTKWILKRAAEPLLPRALIERRKRGLSVPTAALINGALRTQVDEWLGERALREHQLLASGEVRRQLAEHRSGRANHARTLWPAIVLQMWAERWRPSMPERLARDLSSEAPPLFGAGIARGSARGSGASQSVL